MERLGIIAGWGVLPVEVAREAARRGEESVALGVVADLHPDLPEAATIFHRMNVGELDLLIRTLGNAQAHRLVFAGKVTKELIFAGLKPDRRLAALFARLPDQNDDTILHALVAEFESEGIAVVTETEYLSRLLAPQGVLTQRAPSEDEARDVAFGLARARAIAGLDIGQTVVVKNRAVLAVEAIEGTDACIRWGGELGRGRAVVVKVAKPTQDPRFDVPTLGAETLQAAIGAGVTCVAVEAGKTFLADRVPMLAAADAAGVALVGV